MSLPPPATDTQAGSQSDSQHDYGTPWSIQGLSSMPTGIDLLFFIIHLTDSQTAKAYAHTCTD